MCASRQHSPESASTFTRGIAEQETATEVATVVVVDDEPQIASLAGAYLKRLDTDVEVVVETDPRDALAYFEAGGVDCMVSDYDMPVMDGLELLGAVRECDATTPFVLFTASNDPTVAGRARDRNGEYLRKEGDAGGFDRLTERVETLLVGDEN
jgi:CheY-like chemotaxis protein